MKTGRMLVALAVCALALASCGGGGKAGKAKVSKPVDIYFLNFFVRGSDAIAAGAAPRIEQYKKDFPKVTLKEESLGFSDALTKLKSLGAANDLPDLCMPNIPMAKEWAAAGLLRPIDDLLDADPEWKAGFMQGSLDEFKFDGKTYGIPSWKNISGIVFYNEDILAKSGVSAFPETWDGFVDAVAKIKKAGYIPWTTPGKKQWGFSSIASFLNYGQHGAEWFGKLVKGEAKFTDPEFMATLDAMKKLQKAGAFNEDMYSIDQTQARSYYLDGKAAMTVDGTWAVGLISDNAPAAIRDATKIAYLPSASGRSGKVIVPAAGGWGLCISSKVKDENKVAAVGQLIKYVSDSQFGESLLYNGGSYPSSMPKAIKEDKLKPLAVKYLRSLDKVEGGLFWDLAFAPAVIDKLELELELFLLGKQPAKDVGANMQAFYEAQR